MIKEDRIKDLEWAETETNPFHYVANAAIWLQFEIYQYRLDLYQVRCTINGIQTWISDEKTFQAACDRAYIRYKTMMKDVLP